jgi:hypothetical protein
MKSAIQIFFALLIALSFCSFARANTGEWSYEQHKLLAGDFRIHSACMMPAEASLIKRGFKGGEGMTGQTDPWTAALQTLVESHLKSVGVAILPASAVLDSGASDDEVHQVLLAIQEKYQSVSTRLNKKPKDIGKSRYTLGDQVAMLPCSAKSDVLVFVHGDGEVVTKGQTAMGLLVGGPAFSTAAVILTLVDAKTGEVLAFVRLIDVGNFLDNPEKGFGKSLDDELKKMKIGEASGETSHRGP